VRAKSYFSPVCDDQVSNFIHIQLPKSACLKACGDGLPPPRLGIGAFDVGSDRSTGKFHGNLDAAALARNIFRASGLVW
jgi:hypothetical protein